MEVCDAPLPSPSPSLISLPFPLPSPSPQAQRPDELSIRTDEELEVIEWDDGDGWSKGRNHGGQEGYFPQTYIRAVSPSSSPRSSVQQVQQMMNTRLSNCIGPLQQLASQVWHTHMHNMGVGTQWVRDPVQWVRDMVGVGPSG